MAVPDFQTLMLPVLKAISGGEITLSAIVETLSNDYALTEAERRELLPSGKQTRIANRVAWAASYLGKAGLVQRPRRGSYCATDAGRAVLAEGPARIDMKYLERFPAYRAFRQGTDDPVLPAPPVADPAPLIESTPDEIIRSAHAQIIDSLGTALLERIHASPPAFFEDLIVDLLVRMGYGTGADTARAIGQSGDDGVDGVINLDALGVDQVYFQAKRYATGSSIGAGQMRDFFGALAMKDVTKGIFVTTSHFSPSARETAEKLSKRIVLIDGPQLARLMIRHSVGCRVVETFPVSVIDESYFEET